MSDSEDEAEEQACVFQFSIRSSDVNSPQRQKINAEKAIITQETDVSRQPGKRSIVQC